MSKKLGVAFLWHMHQPLYKDFTTGKYLLPWVRLHSTFSYLDMASIVRDVQGAKCTFNFTPSLIYQLLDITQNQKVDDVFLRLTLKNAADLTESDKLFILRNFFSCSAVTGIFAFEKYKQLFMRRGEKLEEAFLKDNKLKEFSVEDMRDIQVFFNLAWCGFTLRENDQLVKDLFRKGGNYTEADKKELIKKQTEVVASILPIYKKLQSDGLIEISTTPYYHPILPLLCRGKNSKEGFDFRPDAVWHVKKAVQLYKEVFGRPPIGMWPAEGSVSHEVISIFAEAGIKWIATDEEILLQSSTGGSHQRDEIVFCPCVARDGANEVSMVFRDTGISNAVSFRYANMPGDVAAESLAKDVNGILDAVKEHRGDHIVSIILDGENPWPYYPDGGKKFLTGVYSLLVSSNGVELVTIGDYLERHKHRVEIKELYSGSWINHDFKKWIGSEQKNKAWSYLERVRKDLFSFSKQDKRSLEELYISESSDWFWWYDEFGTELNFVFDDLFRMHLANIYKINGKKVPAFVEEPIYDKGLLTGAGDVPPIMIPPVIDGKITTDFEWVSAHVVKTRSLSMEMVRTDAVVEEIGYGMDRENLYIMVRPGKNFNKEERYTLQISSASPIRVLIEIPFGKKGKGMATAWDIEMSKEKNINFTTFMFDDVAEMKIPFARLGAEANDEVNFRINVKKNDDIVETWPTVGFFKIIAPGKA